MCQGWALEFRPSPALTGCVTLGRSLPLFPKSNGEGSVATISSGDRQVGSNPHGGALGKSLLPEPVSHLRGGLGWKDPQEAVW